MKRRQQRDVKLDALSEINVTPLVDVMLVLLIIFMVTAPMIGQAVDVALPKALAADMPDDSSRLVITVDKKGEIYISRTKIPRAGLVERLKAINAERNLAEAFMRADRSVPTGLVTEVMSAMRKAGIRRVGMVTEPPERN